ncbi:MAG: GNAT family N-acetyltransferase [Pseudomonadota bacterium]
MSSHDPQPTLVGDFVNLRPLQIEDAELTFGWRQSGRATLLNQGAQTVEQQARWIASRPRSEYNFIIETKSHRPIGMLSLSGVDEVNRRGEPGRFLIGDEAGAQGIPAAAEAMKLLYELAFDRLRLLRVCGTVASDNTLMIKWQRYLGMVEEGRLREHYFINGRFQDAVFFGLLEREYRNVTLPRLNALIAAGRMRVAVNPTE